MNTSTDYEQLETMTYSDFLGESKNLSGVENINSFEYSATTTLAGRWAQIVNADRVAVRVQASILESLRLAEFHNPSDLEVLLLPNGIRFEYSDADFGFSWSISDSGQINLRRTGSSLKRFHNWYRNFMPSASSVLRETVSALDDEVTRSTGRPNNVQIRDLNYLFSLICYNFRPNAAEPSNDDKDNKSVTNLSLMARLLRELPGSDGRLLDAEGVERHDFGRLDYQASRWKKVLGNNVNELFRVEAPSNNAWSSLWFSFLFGGQTLYREDGTRQPFNPNTFVVPEMNQRAYLEFFRDTAVRGFLSSMTSGYTFDTTPNQMP